MFLWRGARDALATRLNLWKRRCYQVPDCPFCPGISETLPHLLVDCPKALEVWNLFPRSSPALVQNGWNFLRWIRGGISCLSSQDAANRLFCGWHIWKRRNRFIFDGVLDHSSTTAYNIKKEERVNLIGLFAAVLPLLQSDRLFWNVTAMFCSAEGKSSTRWIGLPRVVVMMFYLEIGIQCWVFRFPHAVRVDYVLFVFVHLSVLWLLFLSSSETLYFAALLAEDEIAATAL
ncbi:hypothetical protein LINPERPRIM_LOCUS15568 [Linum perenne]